MKKIGVLLRRSRHYVTLHKVIVFLLVVLFIVLSIIYRELFVQIYKDHRCMREVTQGFEPINIHPGTKQELIDQFLQIYDIDLQGPWVKSVSDPGKLSDYMMNCRQVHPDNSQHLSAVLHWLSTVRIEKALTNVDGKVQLDMYTGHSSKFQFILEGGYKALFKVKRGPREAIIKGLTSGKMDPDIHNGEVASYHLQRLLGFNRAPIVVGRKVHFMEELVAVGDDRIKNNTVWQDHKMCIKFSSLVGLKDPQVQVDYLCSENSILEGSMILWIPREMRTTPYINPIKYERNRAFLNDGLKYPVANETIKLLDFIDTVVFDYLIQNGDRHVFYFDPAMYSSILILDNGKGFGDPYTDSSIPLEVFAVRCQIRKTTYVRLQQLSNGVASTVLRQILSRDPIAPVLWEPHYEALDRRLEILLKTIASCIETHSSDYVLVEEKWPPRVNWFNTLKSVYLHYSYDRATMS